ncbi:MAG: ACP S-malonyltransferase, partial [bacterium]
MDMAREKGAKKVIELAVSGAFHSPLMENAGEGLKKGLNEVKIRDAAIPVYANVTAKPVTSAAEIKELLYRQLTSPVRWSESMKNMIKDGADRFLEVGPGRVLAGLLRRIDAGGAACNSVGDVRGLQRLSTSDYATQALT